MILPRQHGLTRGTAHDHLRHLYRNDLEPSANAQFNSPVILSKLITTA